MALIFPIDRAKKLSKFSDEEFSGLLFALEKICGYKQIGNERLELLSKILGHIKNISKKEDYYLVANNCLLSKEEVIKKILNHSLDGVIVHLKDGETYIRSRPSYAMCNIHMSEEALVSKEGEIETLIRIVGNYVNGQPIWGYINGMWNADYEAVKSAKLISDLTGGELVFSMPNDTIGKISDVGTCGVLKLNIDTPIVQNAVKFFRYLIDLSKKAKDGVPIIVIVHSMGAIIAEHALEHLSYDERMRLRIFTLGGASFIVSGKVHPESHNFISSRDIIGFFGSPVLRTLALKKHFSLKAGLDEKQMN